MTSTEEAIAKADAADRYAERFDQWARRLLLAVAFLALVGTPAVIVGAVVLVHQSSTLDKQAATLRADREASSQRDTIIRQQRDLLDKQARFEKLLADFLASTSKEEADAIRRQIGQEFGGASSSSTSTTTTTTVPGRPSSTTTTTRPPSSPPSTAPPSTSPPATAPPPSPAPTVPPAPAIPAPPVPTQTLCGLVHLCISAPRPPPLVTFGP